MVIFNPEAVSCEIYEIKHSKEIVPHCRIDKTITGNLHFIEDKNKKYYAIT